MRALKAAVVFMGVLIVAGVAVLAVLLTQRLSGAVAPAANATIDEPAGTRIVGTSVYGDRIVVQLQGGGPDRLIVLDLRSGHITGRAALAH